MPYAHGCSRPPPQTQRVPIGGFPTRISRMNAHYYRCRLNNLIGFSRLIGCNVYHTPSLVARDRFTKTRRCDMVTATHVQRLAIRGFEKAPYNHFGSNCRYPVIGLSCSVWDGLAMLGGAVYPLPAPCPSRGSATRPHTARRSLGGTSFWLRRTLEISMRPGSKRTLLLWLPHTAITQFLEYWQAAALRRGRPTVPGRPKW